ncbi:hypothetical protein [Sphingomonas sp. AX6]|uniref:hypothetical protein n=1 Tax=Sphingomonas sp. AX6 TaxID=2653171 RepID=UPI0012F1DB50|nr:hypothetical protein [Sphingomonas sp. AX6]VXC57508.1 conserved hypothetical protein [Sphingomonas sp. AX6]
MGGTVISVKGKPKAQTAKASSFGVTKRTRFLDALALTCNVTRAAAHAGVSASTVWRARHRDPVFQEEWREALAIGYDRLEALVLEHGGAGERIVPDPTRVGEDGADAASVAEPFDFDRAMKVLIYRRGERNGEPNRRTGRPRGQATREETNAALLKALNAAKRRVEKQREQE